MAPQDMKGLTQCRLPGSWALKGPSAARKIAVVLLTGCMAARYRRLASMQSTGDGGEARQQGDGAHSTEVQR